MSATILRLMRSEDLPGVNSLLVRAFSAARRQQGWSRPDLPLCRLEFLRYYLSETPSSCWVAVTPEAVFGAVFGHALGAMGWIGPLAVSPEWQNQGFGRALLRHAEEALRAMGCRLVGLETDAGSLHNLAYYSRLGFTPGAMQVDLMRSADPGWRVESAWAVKSYTRHSAYFRAQLPEFLESHRVEADYLALAQRLAERRFGESFLVLRQGRPFFFAAVQLAPVSVREADHVGRVMGLVGPQDAGADLLDGILQTMADAVECRHFVLRLSTRFPELMSGLLRRGWLLVHSHLRYYLLGDEGEGDGTLHLCKWD